LLFKKKNQHWKILCILKNFEPFLWNILKTLNDLYFEQQKMRLPFFEKIFRFSKLSVFLHAHFLDVQPSAFFLTKKDTRFFL
jgi:hypothetical protein